MALQFLSEHRRTSNNTHGLATPRVAESLLLSNVVIRCGLKEIRRLTSPWTSTNVHVYDIQHLNIVRSAIAVHRD